jgi:hypothetical protein
VSKSSLYGARFLGGAILSIGAALTLLGAAAASPATPEETAISAVIADYARAIETKNLELFRSVKPTLSPAEEQRLRAAFANTESHSVKFTLQSIEVKDPRAVVHLARRDTIGSIVASFPQTLALHRGPKGWTIDEIGK